MPHRRPGWVWIGRAVAALSLGGLMAYLSVVGLTKASEIASVVGALIAAAALVVPYLFPPPEQSSSPSAPAQAVTNTVVKGHLSQMRYGRSNLPQAQPGRQQVSGGYVGGNLTQIDESGDQTSG